MDMTAEAASVTQTMQPQHAPQVNPATPLKMPVLLQDV